MGSDPPLDSDILVPADVDGDLIEWDGNDGHLNGILHEVGKYYERKTLFKPLFENRAVVVKVSSCGHLNYLPQGIVARAGNGLARMFHR